jgi:cytochrome c oxidase subunit 3
MVTQKHPFHLVDPSPWPFVCSSSVLFFLTGSVIFFHNFSGGAFIIMFGFCFLFVVLFFWWRDVIRESTFEGQHCSLVQLGLRFGMLLFILSEVWFFIAFFWAFFWSSLSPVPEVGSVWPPVGVSVLEAFEIPFLNTVVLLLSGFSITWSHHSIIVGSQERSVFSLFLTIVLAIFFTLCQLLEYFFSSVTISDGIYGSVFYMSTGFHGLHVIIGTCFLFVCFIRLLFSHFTKQHHFGFEAAAWYWHFVDVVWLFLFVSIYWWGNSI